MASHRQCFYCKQSFQSAAFHAHLKQCPQRQKPNPNQNPGPLQQKPASPYGGYNNNNNMNMGNNMINMNQMNPYQMNNNRGPPPQQRPPQTGNAQLWQCSMCSYQNSPNAQVCSMCQQGKKNQIQANPMQPMQPMQPPMFGNPYNNNNRPPPQQPQPQPMIPQMKMNMNMNMPSNSGGNKESYWECQSCTFVNSIMSASCKICSNPQPKKQNSNNPNPNINPPPNNNIPNSNPNPGNGNGMPPPPNNNKFSQPPGPPPPGPPPNQYDHPMQDKNNNDDMKLQFGGGGMPPPPPMQDDHNNKPSQGPPPNIQQQQPMSGGGGGGGMGGPQEPDDATAALIAQMMAAELCCKCKKNQGFGLPCGDNLCGKCAKKYLLNGIATMKWKKQALVCPGCAKGVIPSWILKECGLGIGMQKKLEEMQNKYMIDSDPSITSCPKCTETYSTESGDLNIANSNDVGPNGKPLQYVHKQHKAKYRFRCSKPGCKCIFCAGCMVTPYHLGYTCDEYKSYADSAKCRFCECSLGAENTAPKDFTLKSGLDNVCSGAECLEKRRWSCDLESDKCGHNCIGLMGHSCIPCLNPKCLPKNADLSEEDYCNICWVDPLKAAPCVKLECGHYFHFMCLWQKIDRKWPAARITFGFLNCPLCKKQIHHPALDDITSKYYDLKKEIQKDAIERVKIEGLQHDKRLTDKSSQYFNNLAQFALDRLAFYPCSKCKKPYFGGMKACEEAGLEQAENYKQEHLVCGSCASGPNAKSCKKHGKKYITYKCKFCCTVSSWYCWGSTHFCDKCHKKQEQGDYLNRKPISDLPKCPGVDQCPLGIEHPANGVSEFSLGCVVCLRK